MFFPNGSKTCRSLVCFHYLQRCVSFPSSTLHTSLDQCVANIYDRVALSHVRIVCVIHHKLKQIALGRGMGGAKSKITATSHQGTVDGCSRFLNLDTMPRSRASYSFFSLAAVALFGERMSIILHNSLLQMKK